MDYEAFIYFAEIVGIAVFAVTGALAAQGKRLDILGVVVLAIVTSLGGGTIRDITLDAHPIGWIVDTSYLWTAIVSAVGAFILCRYVAYPRRALLVLDAMGLALFAILGAQKAMAMGQSDVVVVMMAMITGTAGGMIRDILTREIPLILHRGGEIYATCAIAGAIFFVSFEGLIENRLLAMISMGLIFATRMAAVFADLRLPEFIVAGHRLESDKTARDMEK